MQIKSVDFVNVNGVRWSGVKWGPRVKWARGGDVTVITHASPPVKLTRNSDTISLPTTSDWPARSCQGDFRRHSFVWGQHSAARFCTPVQIEGRGLMGVRVVEEERLFVTRYSVSAPVISAYAVNQLIMLIKPAAFAAREES